MRSASARPTTSSAVTAAQIREVIARLIGAGHWRDGDPDILMVLDAGYDLTRLAWLLRDLPVEAAGPGPAQRPGDALPGRRARHGLLPRAGGGPWHGAVFKLADPKTWPASAVTTITQTTRYGTATATAWSRLHQRLESRCAWEDHDGELPVVEGTVIRLSVDHLPGGQHPEPVWAVLTCRNLR